MNIYLILVIFFLILLLSNRVFSRKTHHIYGSIAKTPKEKERGLMFRKYPLKKNEGLLFVMGLKNNTMWMKNTFIPLDIIFLSKNMNVVGYVEDAEPLSLKTLSINKPSYYVIEMNGNSVSSMNLKIGDHIIFHKN